MSARADPGADTGAVAAAGMAEDRAAGGRVRRALAAHSWVGLLVGAAMYLVCLTGTLLVFDDLLVRWEQPEADEFTEVDPQRLSRLFNETFADPERVTPHLYAVLPTPELPRLRLASERESWWVNADGTLGPPERNAFSELLITLHYYLHLPERFGMALVSALGALLVTLILTGILTHPRILRDAFRLRLGGSRALASIDLHNRLGVWGAPFHLVIGVTGAWFGFSVMLAGAWATLYADGDSRGLIAGMFGPEPEVSRPAAGPVALDRILARTARVAPDDPPFVVTVHDADTAHGHVEVATRIEDRLLYAENHLFDTGGRYLGASGFADGEPGRQVVYSLYRLHFGAFGGLPVRLIYALLGVALTVVSVTGVNAWLARRRYRDALDDGWAGLVWGLPPALAVAAIVAVVLHGPPAAVFGATWGLAILLALRWAEPALARRRLQAAGALALTVLAVGHALRVGLEVGPVAPAVLAPDLVWLGAALALGWRAMRPPRVVAARRERPV